MINSNACFTYLNKIGGIPIMSKAMDMALLKEASEMFNETGCVPGIDGEEVPAERIVPEAKEYISETIDDPEVMKAAEDGRRYDAAHVTKRRTADGRECVAARHRRNKAVGRHPARCSPCGRNDF
jgi:hypothetical protein